MPCDTPDPEGVGISGNPSGLAPDFWFLLLESSCVVPVEGCRGGEEIMNYYRRDLSLGMDKLLRAGQKCEILLSSWGWDLSTLCSTGGKRKLHLN